MHPQPPPAEADRALDRRLARHLRLARAALAWERLWPLVLPPVAVAGVFVALALFDVLPHLPPWLHGLVLSLGVGALSFLLVRAALRFRAPTLDEAARRLERDSGLPHRPLQALSDRLAGQEDPLSQALWQAHRHRMASLLGALRVAVPHPGMAARDPWCWRAAVLLLLVIAASGGWRDAGPRLARALTPDLQAPGFAPDALEVWVTPPAHTGLPPLLLKPGQPGPVAVPAGSALLAVLAGGWGGATLVVDESETEFQRQGDGAQRVETVLRAGRRLAVRQAGREVAAWPLALGADALPSAAFAVPPEAGERGRLHLAVTASDDFGLAKVWVEIQRLGPPTGEPPLVVELPLSGNRPKNADLSGWHDLTAHPWSGLPVSLRPVAQDGAGQTGAGEAVAATLPERQFHHPVARAVVEQRRLLTESRTNARGAVALLDAVTADPSAFSGDVVAFLALRVARHALTDGDFDLAEAQDLLWNAALRIEEGDLPSAERNLEEARRALEQALDEGASAERLDQLLDQFQAALDRYLDTLAQRLAEQGKRPDLAPQSDRVLSDDDLRRMLDGMREMAQTGARDGMRDMLKNLSRLLDGLQAGPPQPVNPAVAEAMGQLRDVAKRQQELLDHSHRRAQGEPGKRGAEQDARQAQEALRKSLGEAARKLGEALGEPPQGLGRAGEAMADAAGQLGRGQWGEAAESQAQALAQLGQAVREAMEQLGQAGPGMFGAVPRDPLGRPQGAMGGMADDGTTRIPDRADLQRAREILDELRRRAGEVQRPESERDYLHRLLKQF